MADEKTPEAKQKPEEKGAKPAADAKEEHGLSPDAKKKDKKEKEKKQGTEKKVKKVDYGPDFRYIVRLANSDLDGTRRVEHALTGIRGVGHRVGPILADAAGVPRTERIGKLSDAQIEQLAKTLERVSEILPGWAVNRPFDYETGADMHLVGSNVDIVLRDDLNRLKKIRSYRGVRHELGQKVRGQRTRSHGRTGLAVGVARQKAIEGEKKEGEAAAPGAAPAAKGITGAKPLGGAKPAAGAAPAAAPAAGGAKPAPAAGGAKPAAKPEGGKK